MDPAMREKAARISEMLNDQLVRSYLGVNEHEKTLYYSKEQFEQLIRWLFSLGCLSTLTANRTRQKKRRSLRRPLRRPILLFILLTGYSVKAGYRLHDLAANLSGKESS